MKTRIQKGKNNLMVSIPDNFATAIGLNVDSVVEISLVNGQLIIESVHKQSPTLDDLLSKVNKYNLHQEIDTGMSVGKEMW